MDPAEQNGADGVLGRGRASLTIGLLLTVAVFAVEGMGVVPALPTAVSELGGLAWFGWSFSAFMLAWLFGSVVGGWIADGRGPRLSIALGLTCFGAGLLTAATAHSMAQLLVGRALQGLGGGGLIAGTYVGIARGYPEALRARMFALNSSVWILPAVMGPALSGKVTEAVGWRWVFIGIVPFVFLCAALVLRPLRRFDARVPMPPVRRMTAALQLAIGAGLVIAAPSLRVHGVVVMTITALSGLAIAAPGFRSVLPRGTLSARRGLPTGLLMRGLLGFAFFGTEAFIPLAAARLRGATPTEAGVSLSAGAIGWVIAAWLAERIEAGGDSTSRPFRVRMGFLLLAMGIAIVTLAVFLDAPLWMIPVGWAVSGAGTGLAFPSNSLACIAAAPPGAEGDVSGQLQLTEALGTSLGAGLGGVVLSTLDRAQWAPRNAQLLVFAITLSSALLGALLAPRLRAHPDG